MQNRPNEEWLTNLRSIGEQRKDALTDLTKIIIERLPFALSKWIQQDDPRSFSLIEDVAQETLLRVLAHLDTFEGRSQFTTWVYTIATRVALTELRRKRWMEISLNQHLEGENDDEPLEIPDKGVNVENSIVLQETMLLFQEVMREKLTKRQRNALLAVAIQGMPLEEISRRMGIERNTLYKLLHDARLKLKRHLKNQGFTYSEFVKVLE